MFILHERLLFHIGGGESEKVLGIRYQWPERKLIGVRQFPLNGQFLSIAYCAQAIVVT